MTVREALVEEFDVIYDTLLSKMHADSSYADLVIDRDVCRLNFQKCLASDSAICLLWEVASEIRGIFIGYVAQIFFSKDPVAYDLLVYIDPKHRGGFGAKRLLDAFERWAKDFGAKQIRVGTATGHTGAEPLYERSGYITLGKTYMKEVV